MTIQNEPTHMSTQPTEAPRPIVVGYDGSSCSIDALHWAIEQASARHRPVRLASALDNSYMGAGRDLPYYPQVQDEWRSLKAVREAELEKHPGMEFQIDVRLGMIIKMLAEQGERGELMVLGKRGLGAFSRVALGSVSIAVAGRAGVPIVIVPPGWKTTDHGDQPVVVGLHPFRPNAATLDFAFAEAARQQVGVVVVDAQGNPPLLVWDVNTGEPSYLVTRRRERVEDELELFRKQYPDVAVTVASETEHPTEALLDHAERAQLVVVGRHHSGLAGFGVGSVARGVLHHAEIPVAVVPSS